MESQYYTQTPQQVLHAMESREEGLTTQQAQERIEKNGPNALREERKKPVWQVFLEQFKDLLVVILVVAAVISMLSGNAESTIVIFAVLILNAVLGTVQHCKAEKSLESLKAMSAPTARVFRDGERLIIPSVQIVPGDIVELEAGDMVVADGRILHNYSLKVNESSLTGESEGVEKTEAVIEGDKVALGDRKNLVFSGSLVVYGRALVVVTNTGLHRDDIVYERSNTWIAPDSGDTSGSRQTLVTGEATRRACEKLSAALEGKTMGDLVGQEFYGEYLAKTDPLGADVPNPVSHVAYGYATQMCVLDKKTGRIKKMVAAHDVGKAVNPLSIEGQIEGGVVMSMGFALTERYPLTDCRPTAKYGTLGLFRANQIPEITPIIVEKAGLNVACGAIGIGEITSIPTAPAIADAYYRYDGKFRTSLPLEGTPYSRK